VLDGRPQAIDGERGGGHRQHPGGQRAVVLPGGEPAGLAVALGACGGLARILMPSAVNTASKELVN
jgi:hypothetical protein